jgi:hypothetical protein
LELGESQSSKGKSKRSSGEGTVVKTYEFLIFAYKLSSKTKPTATAMKIGRN